MTKLLRIKDWHRHEHADARKGTRMPWVKTPTTHDGLGFLTLLDHADGMAHFGAWNLIMQLAANCPTRGLLQTDGGRPLLAKEMALKTRGNQAIFQIAIDRLIDIGWLEWVVGAVGLDHTNGGSVVPVSCDAAGAPRTRPFGNVSGECRESVKTHSRAEESESESREEGRVEKRPTSPAPRSTLEDRRRELRSFLSRKRLASDDTALEEWAGLIEDAKVKSADEGFEFVVFVKALGKSEGITSRYAKDYERFLIQWRAKRRKGAA